MDIYLIMAGLVAVGAVIAALLVMRYETTKKAVRVLEEQLLAKRKAAEDDAFREAQERGFLAPLGNKPILRGYWALRRRSTLETTSSIVSPSLYFPDPSQRAHHPGH